MRSSQLGRLAAVVLLAISAATSASAQVLNSGAQAININATLQESISLTLSGNSVNFALTAGSASNPGSTGITATTAWVSKPGRNLTVYAYFNSAPAALTDGAGDNIASSDFEISDNGGAFTPVNNSVPFGAAGAGLPLSTTKITGLNKSGSKTDNMLFNINLSTLPQLPANTYTGVLWIRAQIN
ncbi:MAG TPA: hypothetical protein VFI95_05035 [Terriglobales bacterium]|nr:hypothetical protein [Terriglobales bacterium]